MRKVELRKLMKNLYKSGDYYASIEPESNDFEESYHKVKKDPDGVERNLLDEREYRLSTTRDVSGYLDKIKPGKILDVGCGPGRMLSALDDSWEKYGIEVSKFASNYAKKYCKVHNGTLETFREENFDVIIFYHVVEHLIDPISAIKKINKLLKPGGKLIIGTPDFDSGAARRYESNFRLLHDKTHISLFSCDSMHRYLRDHGFKIIDVTFPYFETPWFNEKDLLRLFDKDHISPPFYGSSMTFLCKKIDII